MIVILQSESKLASRPNSVLPRTHILNLSIWSVYN